MKSERPGESGIIAAIVRRFPADSRLRLGPGDDAAILARPGRAVVATTDLLIEGVHFRRSWMPASCLGHKALAVNLSDLAAMGAEPVAFLLDLALPEDWTTAETEAFADGLAAQARRHGVALAGGDTCAGPSLYVGVTVLGEVEDGGFLTRSGGRPGDRLAVTGRIGAAAAGLALLEMGWRLAGGTPMPPTSGAGGIDVTDASEVLIAQLTPEPEVAAGRALAGVARAGIDLSDGLAADLRRLCQASACGARIEAGRLPLHPAARRIWQALGRDPVHEAVRGGEDYRLLVVLPAGVDAPTPVTAIGELTDDADLRLVAPEGEEQLPEPAFAHFKSP